MRTFYLKVSRRVTNLTRIKVHVLSYFWCGDLIRSALSSVGLNALNENANEFTYEESVSTGKIIQNVESPIDNLLAFKDILQKCSNDKKNLRVCIGDSVGDLLWLLSRRIVPLLVGRDYPPFFTKYKVGRRYMFILGK